MTPGSRADMEQALYAPPGLRFERPIGDLLLVVMGMADSTRLIAVLCDRLASRVNPSGRAA